MANHRTNESYTIAWVCALPIEQAAAQGMLDERHPTLPTAKDDTNNYRFGRIGEHNVVIAVLKAGGTTPAAVAATNLLRSFPSIRFGLMVGVGGGAPGRPHKDPQKDIRLGDVVVSSPSGEYGGVIQYDLGKSLNEGTFVRTGNLNNPPAILGNAVAGLRGDALLEGYQIQPLVDKLVAEYPKAGFHYPEDEPDKFFASDYSHIKDDEADDDDCTLCEDKGLLQRKQRKGNKAPEVHYGLIGSANQVLRNSEFRDKLRKELGIMCFEMEAGGLMNDFPCLVVRGICDYCDSHKNKQWQAYAAATAAAYAKQLLGVIAPAMVVEQKLAREVVGILETQTFALDQLKSSIAKAEAKLDLKGLVTVPNAAFDSHVDYDEQDSTCLIGTRIDVLQKIRNWVTGVTDRSIFWLNGMAGVGKSTIARTVAQEFAQRKQLGASFFFKGGEGDRQSCRYLFTTIAFQLAQSLPLLRQAITTAINENPEISYKALKEQFDNLILSPIRANASQLNLPVVIVIDALDECIDQDKLHIVVGLLSEFRTVEPQNIRILLTSRREQVLDDSFKDIAVDVFEDIILHEITETMIEQDISTYLGHKFDQIKIKRQYELCMDWPGHKALKSLTQISSPLFIFAATICRFVGDRRADPMQRLQSVLERKQTSLDKLQQTYQPILEAMLGIDNEEDILQDFRIIVGTIVVLVEPLTAFALSQLLNLKHGKINFLMNQLHSVLRISSNLDTPIRTLHASFGDYLLYPRQKHSFYIDAREVHRNITLRCLDILQFSDYLSKGDICDLKDPGFSREDIDVSTINSKLPTEIRYACCHWVHHLKESSDSISVIEDQIYAFFDKRFLIWFEALSLFGRAREAISMLSDLSTFFSNNTNPSLKARIHDARRFVTANSHIADLAPLQLYSSCTIFSPQRSFVRTNASIPAWIKTVSGVPDKWGILLQTLEGHKNSITSLAYSPDGNVIASSSLDYTVKLWIASSGQLQQTLIHPGMIQAVTFSPDGKLLTSGCRDGTIKFWDVNLGGLQQNIIAHSHMVISVAFSPDGRLLASGSSDKMIKLWDVASGELQRTYEDLSDQALSVIFSPSGGKLLACGLNDGTIKIWEVASGELQHTFKGHLNGVNSLIFTPDGKLLASGSDDRTIKLWDVASGELLRTLVGHLNIVGSIAFSPSNSKLLVSGSWDSTIKIWEVTSGKLQHTLTGLSGPVNSVIFSPNGKFLVSVCIDSIQLWDGNFEEELQQPSEQRSFSVISLAFSPDGRLLASGSDDKTVKLWTIISEEKQLWHTFTRNSSHIKVVAFSQDGKLIASGLNSGTIEVWSIVTKRLRQRLDGGVGPVQSVSFSSNSDILVASSDDMSRNAGSAEFSLWDIGSGRLLKKLQGVSWPRLVACSSDGKLLICYNSEESRIELWDVNSGNVIRYLKIPGHINRLSFDDEFSLLQTNLGSIKIGGDMTSIYLQQDYAKYDVEDEDADWILGYGKRLLWLPPEYRGVFTCHQDLIALGPRSGRIILLELALEELDLNDEDEDEDDAILELDSWIPGDEEESDEEESDEEDSEEEDEDSNGLSVHNT